MEDADIARLNTLTNQLTLAREFLGKIRAVHEQTSGLIDDQVKVFNAIAVEHKAFVDGLKKKPPVPPPEPAAVAASEPKHPGR